MSDTKQRGRPEITVVFPTSGEFGITELAAQNPNVSKVTLQLKVNQHLINEKLRVIRLRQNGKGRPAKVYSWSQETVVSS